MLQAVPKQKTPRDKKYLAFVRKQPCCICGSVYLVAAHHTTGNGTGSKGSDYETAPACNVCHMNIHRTGRKDNIPNLKNIIARLRIKYILEGGKINE